MERKITKREIEKIREMLSNDENITKIARTLGVARITIYRHIHSNNLRKKQGFLSKFFGRMKK